MVREARIQIMLTEQGFPVPDILAVGEDPQVLGVPFYVMGYLDGVVITDDIPAELDAPPLRRATSATVVDTLVSLHSLDVVTGPLAGIGRPDGYLKRQIERFGALWEVNTLRDLPEVARLARWLEANRPESQRHSLIHGDYRIGNLMFAHSSNPRVIALLDWEMATLGDPLADLGYLTATYAEPGEPATTMELTPVTRNPGYLRRPELVSRYQQRTDMDLVALPWYQTLALWKAAIFSEAIYTRWLKGERPEDTTFSSGLEQGVPALLAKANKFAALLP
jgi:aminoglycoside phosphotransferase (APT) family kinase protein